MSLLDALLRPKGTVNSEVDGKKPSPSSPTSPPAEATPFVPPPEVIEVIFRPCEDDRESVPIEAGFRPCPQCGYTRYWVSRGYLRCGSKACNSAPRFALVAVSYRPIN
jgi:hypothetical protein